MAFDVTRASWGLTPVIDRGLFSAGGGTTVSGEMVIRTQRLAGVWARNAYLDFTSMWQRWNFDAAALSRTVMSCA